MNPVDSFQRGSLPSLEDLSMYVTAMEEDFSIATIKIERISDELAELEEEVEELDAKIQEILEVKGRQPVCLMPMSYQLAVRRQEWLLRQVGILQSNQIDLVAGVHGLQDRINRISGVLRN